jgi:hypothetical protein
MSISNLDKTLICYEPSESDYFNEYEYEDFLRRIKKNLIAIYKSLIKNPKSFLYLQIIIGLIFFTLPFLFFWYKFYNIKIIIEDLNYLSIFTQPKNQIIINTSVVWLLISAIFMLIYTLLILVWKILDMLQIPNLKHWNIYHMGYSIQYLIFFVIMINFFSDFFSILSQVDFIVSEAIRKSNSNINNLINFNLFNMTEHFEKLIYEVIENFKNSLNSIFIFSIFYLIRLLIFESKYFINYLIITFNFIFIHLTIKYVKREVTYKLDCIMFYFMLIFCSYFSLIILEILKIQKNKLTSIQVPKSYFKKIVLIFQVIRLIGTYLLIHINLIYFLNDSLNFQQVKEIFHILIYAFLLLIIAHTYFSGWFIVDFLFYSIRKEFLIYKNEKYKSYIKRVNTY